MDSELRKVAAETPMVLGGARISNQRRKGLCGANAGS